MHSTLAVAVAGWPAIETSYTRYMSLYVYHVSESHSRIFRFVLHLLILVAMSAFLLFFLFARKHRPFLVSASGRREGIFNFYQRFAGGQHCLNGNISRRLKCFACYKFR